MLGTLLGNVSKHGPHGLCLDVINSILGGFEKLWVGPDLNVLVSDGHKIGVGNLLLCRHGLYILDVGG